MKILVVMLSLMTLQCGFAQEVMKKEKAHKTPEEKAIHVTAKMTEKLGLSTEQQTKIGNINLNYAKKLQAIRENKAISKEEKHKQLDATKATLNSEYKTNLTSEQYVKFEEWKKKQAEHRAEKAKEHSNKVEEPTDGDL